MDFIKQQRDYRESEPSVVGRGIERLTRPLSTALSGTLPSELLEKIVRGIDRAATRMAPRQFDHDISDLTACHVAAKRVESRAKDLNAASGFVSGLGGALSMSADIPATIALSMRNISETGRAYGYDGRGSAEQLFRLNILELAAIDGGDEKRQRIAGLEAGIVDDGRLIAREPAVVTPLIDQATERLARALAFSFVRAKLGSVIPVVGSVVSGAVNSAFQGDVSKAAQYAYQQRRLR